MPLLGEEEADGIGDVVVALLVSGWSCVVRWWWFGLVWWYVRWWWFGLWLSRWRCASAFCGLGFGRRWCGLLPWWWCVLFRVRPGVLLLLWWLWWRVVGGCLEGGWVGVLWLRRWPELVRIGSPGWWCGCGRACFVGVVRLWFCCGWGGGYLISGCWWGSVCLRRWRVWWLFINRRLLWRGV